MGKINFLIFLFFLLSNLKAEIYYVSPNGNNYNDGKSIEKAWKTPDRGLPTYLREDAKEGDKIIYVARASQFPEKGKVLIGNKEVSYLGRTADSLIGCEGVPDAKRGTKVISLDWEYAKGGDKIIILEGVYTLKEKFSDENKEWAGGKDCVFYFNFIAPDESPVIIEGNGNVIIDGRFLKRSIIVNGKNIKIKNLKLRRGGIGIFFSKNIDFYENFVFYGIHSIFVRYSEDVDIHHNLIYDFHGAWTEPGINIGDSKKIRVKNNTIVNCGCGINFWGGIEEIEIKNNIISWCGTGIKKDEKIEVKKEDIKDNVLWANGNVVWLYNLDKKDKNEGKNHYIGFNFQPDDIYEDPKIVNWYSNSKNFLSPHKNSVCFQNGKMIGAKEPSDYEKTFDYKEGVNILPNGSFEFGFYNWRGTSWWPFNFDEAKWEIINNNAFHGEKCLYLRESPKGKGRSAPAVMSSFFPVNKGKIYTISFYAKGKGRLGVGFAVPSWHTGSSFGEIVNLTDEWKNYKVKIKLPDFSPDWVAVKFSSDWSEAYIDKVIVYEGETENVDYPPVEIFYREENGFIQKKGIIPVMTKYYSETRDFLISWEIIDPYMEKVASGKFEIKGEEEKDVKVNIDDGLYLFKYEVYDKNLNFVSNGYFRFVIGRPLKLEEIENRDFIAGTPPYKHYSNLNEFENMVKKISSYGVGTFHIYAGLERIKELIKEKNFENYLSITEKYGINWLVTLSDKVNDDNIKIWKENISEFVKKFKGRIKYYEIMNEPNTFMNGDEYVKIFSQTAPLIKEIDPEAHIIAGSIVNALRQDLYNKTLQLPPSSFDFFSFHPYRFGIMNPEIQGSFREQMRMVKGDLNKNGHGEKIFLTEEGMAPSYERTRCIGSFFSYSTPIWSILFTEDELLWANFAMRMYLTALGERAKGYNYHTLPVFYIDGNITPSYLLKALHTMAQILGNSYSITNLDLSDDFVGYLFKGDDKIIAVIWKIDCEWGNKTEVEIEYGGKFEIYDMFGKKLNYKKGRLVLDRHIYYFLFPTTDIESVIKIIEKSIIKGKSSKIKKIDKIKNIG
jgi:hypothetical protein